MKKINFDNKLSSLNKKITSNTPKHLIVENELKKLETFHSIYFRGKGHFENDGTQVFQTVYRYLKTVSAIDSNILSSKSKWFSDKRIKPPTTSNKTLNPSVDYDGTKTRVKFNEHCLQQEKITFNHGEIVNIYIAYEIERSVNVSIYPTLKKLFIWCSNDIGFDRKWFFSISDEFGRNVIIFGRDMSSSSHIDNKKKDILIIGKVPTQGLEHTLVVEKLYSINFTKENTKFCLNLYYNGANSYLLVNGTEIIKFKARDSEITPYPLCLGNISKDWSVDNMKKIGLKGYVHDFSVDYDAIAVSDILDVYKYLIKKNEIV